MHFSKIYVQKNFVPNVALDPFGRQSIGIEVTLSDKEDVYKATESAEAFIKEYIQKNTTENPHIVERTINDGPLPEIQASKKGFEIDYDVVMDEIEGCKTLDELEQWKALSSGNPVAKSVYDTQLKKLKTFNI